jgi:hypothetical protein
MSRIQRNASRLPEPIRFTGNLTVERLARYVDDLVKTLRIRMEGIETEMSYQDIRTKVVETEEDFAIGTDTPIILVNGTVTLELPNARDAYNDQSIIKVRVITGSATVAAQQGEQIEGGASVAVALGASIEIVSDGDNWWILASYP